MQIFNTTKMSALLTMLMLSGRAAWAAPVAVKVVGPDDKPIAGARLWMWNWAEMRDNNNRPKTHRAVTDDKGSASFEVSDKGANVNGGFLGSVLALAPGFGFKTDSFKREGTSVKLARGGVARGVVVDEAGKPVEGAAVTLQQLSYLSSDAPDLEAEMTTKSGADGRFALKNLPLENDPRTGFGPMSFELRDDRFGRSTAPMTIVTEDVAAPNAAVAPEAAQSTLTARPAASLSGRVVGEEGQALPDVPISVMREGENGPPRILKSDKEGKFQVGQLAPGPQTVTASPPADGDWTMAKTRVVVTAGQTLTVPDVTLTHGALIEGRVVDAADGKGVAEAYINVQQDANSWGGGIQSDKDGKFKLRVPPGKRLLAVQATGAYLQPESGTYNKPLEVEVEKGATKTIEIKLTKGKSAAGVVVDEKGAPLVGVMLALTNTSKGERYNREQKSAVSEVGGRVKMEGLSDGQWKLSSGNPWDSSNEWQIVSPKTFSVPAAGNVRIVARRTVFQNASGRVLSPDGKPVEGAAIKAQLQVPAEEENSTYGIEKTATTDADGRWKIDKVAATTTQFRVTATKPGHAFVKSGEVKKVGDAWTGEDTILKPLIGRIAGRVVDDKNAPLSGVKVLSPDGEAFATTDAEGRFALKNLNDGEITLVAIGDKGAVTVKTRAATEDRADGPTLMLKPPSPAPERDYERARALLDDAWQTSKGREFWERSSIPVELALSDPDDALALAGNDKQTAEEVLSSVILALAKYDSARASEWAPDKIAGITNIATRLLLASEVGRAVWKTNPALSQKLLDQARGWAEAAKPTEVGWSGWSALAQLGALLKAPQADAWFQKALDAAGKDLNSNGQLAIEAAEVRGDWAEKAIEVAKAGDATAQQYSMKSGYYASHATRRLVAYDLPAAQRMYDKYSKFKDDNNSWAWPQAEADLAVAKAAVDLEGALKQVRDMNQPQIKGRAFAQIALIAPARALELLQEAATSMADQRWGGGLAISARLAALVYDLDAKAGAELLNALRTRAEVEPDQGQNYNRGTEIAAVAWTLRKVDAAAARLMLEREWARQARQPADDNNSWSRNREMGALALSMCAFDVERATEMAWLIPISANGGEGFRTLRGISRWLLASQADRDTKPFIFWSQPLSGDDDYNNDGWM